MYKVFSIWEIFLVLSHGSFWNTECLGHIGQYSSHLTLATSWATSSNLILQTFSASVEQYSNHPKAVGQIPPGRGGSRGALVASPGASNKYIARELLHLSCLGWKGQGNLIRCLGQTGKGRLLGCFLLRKRLRSNRSNYIISLFFCYSHLFKKSVILLYQSCNDYLMSGCLWTHGAVWTEDASPQGICTAHRTASWAWEPPVRALIGCLHIPICWMKAVVVLSFTKCCQTWGYLLPANGHSTVL